MYMNKGSADPPMIRSSWLLSAWLGRGSELAVAVHKRVSESEALTAVSL